MIVITQIRQWISFWESWLLQRVTTYVHFNITISCEHTPVNIHSARNNSSGTFPLMPNDHYSGRTAPLTSKRCILYIYSTNIATEYFKHGIYSPFFSSSKCSLFHNSNVFGSCIIHILYTGCAKIRKKFRRQKVNKGINSDMNSR